MVLGPGFPEVLSPLPVGGAGSLGGLLRGPRGLRGGVGLLVGRAQAWRGPDWSQPAAMWAGS